MSKDMLHPTWILVARVGLFLLVFILLLVFSMGISHRINELQVTCNVEPCPLFSLTDAEETVLDATLFSMRRYAFLHLSMEISGIIIALTITTLIFLKGFNNLAGIMTAYFLIMFGLSIWIYTDDAFWVIFPQLEWVLDLIIATIGYSTLSLFFVFPNGQFVPKFLRWSPIVLAIVGFTMTILDHFGNLGGIPSLTLVYTSVLCGVVGLSTQIYRYRNVSNVIERQQTKWALFGFISLAISIMSWTLLIEIFAPVVGQPKLLINTIGYVFIFITFDLFPISLGIAIIGHRLWDIDLIIRRTLQYSLVSGILAAVYFTTVALIQNAITAVGGQPSVVVIVLSTLLIATLFNPLRTRIQTLIDRHFYRSSYDAQATLARFAETARDEVELERLTAGLLQVVQETMQPEHVTVWLKNSSSSRNV